MEPLRVTVHVGHVIDALARLPERSVHTVVTSPPYYGLRDYGTAEWEGGDPACLHLRVQGPSSYGERKLKWQHANNGQTMALARGGQTRLRDATEQRAFEGPYRQKPIYPAGGAVCADCGAVRTEPTVWGGDPACPHEWSEIVQPSANGAWDFMHGGTLKPASATRRPKVSNLCGRCGAWRGALGLEPVHDCLGWARGERCGVCYVCHVREVMAAVRRVLRDDGTVWLNIGDSYATGGGRVGEWPGGRGQGERWRGYRGEHAEAAADALGRSRDRRRGVNTVDPKARKGLQAVGPMTQPNRMPLPGLKPKDLIGMPQRLFLALQADGWWVRSDVVWHKENPMPESIRDRPTRAHEFVLLLAKGQWSDRMVELAHLPDHILHGGDDRRPDPAHARCHEFCVAVASAILQSPQAQEQFGLALLDAHERGQGGDGAASTAVGDVPAEQRALRAAARFLYADPSAKRFLEELHSLGLGLADGNQLVISGGTPIATLPPPFYADHEGAITVQDASEICKYDLARHVLIISRVVGCRYYYDADAIREPFAEGTYRRVLQSTFDTQEGGPKDYRNPESGVLSNPRGTDGLPAGGGMRRGSGVNENRSSRRALENLAPRVRESARGKTAETPHLGGRRQAPEPGEPGAFHPLGRNKRDVWSIPTEPFPEAHFATFPGMLVLPCVQAGTSERGACPSCGKPWVRLTAASGGTTGRDWNQHSRGDADLTIGHTKDDVAKRAAKDGTYRRVEVGWRPGCVCNAPADLGLQPDDFDVILSPEGGDGEDDDPTLFLGRAGFGRERADDEGTRVITRYEQRKYAEQLRASPRRADMEAETAADTGYGQFPGVPSAPLPLGSEAFAHYLRTDDAGARPIPSRLLEAWVACGWLERVEVPDWTAWAPEPVPCTVLDPFAGSGTTLLVAAKNGRRALGVELKPDYVGLIRKRLAPLAGDLFSPVEFEVIGDVGGVDDQVPVVRRAEDEGEGARPPGGRVDEEAASVPGVRPEVHDVGAGGTAARLGGGGTDDPGGD